MSAEQTAAELTTRGVLLQIDRRLTLIEGDLRGLDAKIEGVDTRLSTRIEALDIRLNSRMDTKFYWTLGTILLTWISTIATMLLK